MLDQLEKIIDKQKNKMKYKKFGVDISNVIFCHGNVSLFTCNHYIEALAGELGRNLIRLSGKEIKFYTDLALFYPPGSCENFEFQQRS